MMMLLDNGPPTALSHLILAHGAGAPMSSSFLESLAFELGREGVRVTRFEFAYMAGRHVDGVKRPPPRVERLAAEYQAVISGWPAGSHQRLYIGGKSMGARVASQIAGPLHARGTISGLVAVGYPFHPPRKPESLRVEHLMDVGCPTFIVQGTRDPLGSASEVESYGLPPSIEIEWLEDGDHDLKPRRASGHTQAGHIALAARAIAQFMERS